MPPSTSAFAGWPTYGFDGKRDGFNPNTSLLTPASIASLHLAWQTNYNDYNTQTQPILAANVGGHRGLLFVGGASGKIVAFDATTGAPQWQRFVGQTQFTCSPNGGANLFGIGGSVAYDPGSQSIYVPANANTSIDGPTQTSLVRLSAANGSILGQIDLGANSLPGEINFAHTSVTIANGRAYIGTSSTCDISAWRGRIASADLTLSNAQTFYTVYSTQAPYSGGGVWGWGGVSVDDAGNLYAGVGNADTNAGSSGPQAPFVRTADERVGLGDNFIKLRSDLALLARHSPSASASGDLDLTGSPTLFTPFGCSDTLAAIQGKSGFLLTYDTQALGSGPASMLQVSPSTSNAPYLGNPGYSPITGLVYAAVETGATGLASPGLLALKPTGCNLATTMTIAWRAAFGPDSYSNGEVQPRSAVSVTAGGVVFVGTPCTADGTGGCQPTISGRVGGALWALDATSGAVLNNGKPILITGAVIRMAPVVDGNWIFVTDNGSDLYGFTTDPAVPARQATFVTRYQPTLPRRQLRRM